MSTNPIISKIQPFENVEILQSNVWPAGRCRTFVHTRGTSDSQVCRRDIFGRKFKSRSKFSPESIAWYRLTVPGSPRMLKGWPEMRVIFRLQPNRQGIKLRVGHDRHFKTTNEISGTAEGGRRAIAYSPNTFFLG